MGSASDADEAGLANLVASGLADRGIVVDEHAERALGMVLAEGAATWSADVKADGPTQASGWAADASPESDFRLHLDELVDRLTDAARADDLSAVSTSELAHLMRRVCPVYPWCRRRRHNAQLEGES